MAGSDGTIKNRIVIEGEAQYKKALAEINRALRESKSEMRAVTAEYATNSTSAQALEAQIGVLERTHAQQTEQLHLMTTQLGKVEDAYGKNSREATELRTKINNARAEMAKTANELAQLRSRLDTTADAMDDASRGTQDTAKAMDDIGNKAGRAADDVGDLSDALGGLSVDKLADVALKGASIGAIGKGIGTALTLSDEQVQAWNQLAASTGATGEALEGLKTATKTVYQGGSGENLSDVAGAVSAIYQLTSETDKGLSSCTTTALSLRDVFNMDVSESARAAAVLMQEFGISGEEAYDLIAYGAQNGADKNGNLLDTINEYSPYFSGAGKGADEFFYALTEGAQSGVYDVDKIGDAWKEFMLRLTGGDQGAKDALGELGFAAEDVTRKIAHGGDAADLATSEIIAALARTEDPYERNRLGVALFGTQWEDVSGKVLPIFDSMGEGLDDVKGSADALNKANLSDFDTALEGTQRRIKSMFAEFFSPTAQQATALLNGVNAVLDGKGSDGFWQAAAVDSGIQDQNIAQRQQLMEEYGLSEGEAFLAQIRGGDVGAAQSYRKSASVVDTIKGWFTGEDVSGAVSTGAQDVAASAAEQTDTQMSEQMPAAGAESVVYMTDGMEESIPLVEGTAQNLGDAAIDSIAGTQPDMDRAGVLLGEAGVMGLEDGSAGMEGAGENAAQGAVQGARSQMDAMYNAGASLGGAFRRGFQQKLMIHSPSRAAMEDMAYVTEGYLIQIERDRARLSEGAAAMADAVREPMRRRTGTDGFAAQATAGGVSADELAQAVRSGMSGMVMVVDKEVAGRLLEPSVSRETSARVMGTVSGLSNAAKNW